VEKLKFRDPPSALNPRATDTASRSVDLPVPFSPTRKVTSGSNWSSSRWRTAGIVKGYFVASAILSRFSEISRR